MSISFLQYNPDDLQALRKVLKKADFTPQGVLDTLKIKDSMSIGESNLLLLLYRTSKGRPLDWLIRLFLIEVPVPIHALQQAIHPMKTEEWINMGLIYQDGDSALAKIKLFPYQDSIISSDLPHKLLSEESNDFVMGIGGSSLTLANLTTRRPSALTLDLGTGCGFQAFLAARQSEKVIAVDRNPRAVKVASFNAKLNGLSNIECLEGDLFDPVKGQKFDLIISNPPFVISPETRYIYRDSGLEGDQICQKITRLAPDFLQEGGYCQILCNWIEYSNQDWRQRLADWFKDSGCDVWVMRNQTHDVATYATTWIRHTEKHEKENLHHRFHEWMSYYEKKSIDKIGGGLITMRRAKNHQNWFRAEDGLETMFGPCGDQIVQGFELQDFLEGLTDNKQLLRTCFRLSSKARLVHLKAPSSDKWKEVSSELRLERGFAHFKGTIDPYVERLLIGCDGTRELTSLAHKMATDLNTDYKKVAPLVCNIVRHLVGQGFLLPSSLS